MDPSTDEGDVEEIVEEDQRLIRAWINVSINAVVGTDQKKSSF